MPIDCPVEGARNTFAILSRYRLNRKALHHVIAHHGDQTVVIGQQRFQVAFWQVGVGLIGRRE
jgi:hypothetical protein